MPRISYFFGIVIRMFYNDHLPPQFHAEYGNDEAVVRNRDAGSFTRQTPSPLPCDGRGMGNASPCLNCYENWERAQ